MTNTATAFSLFSLKGGLFPLTSLQLLSTELSELSAQLENKIKQAPHFFQNAPMVLDVHKLNTSQQAELDLSYIRFLFKKLQLVIVGIQGAKTALQKMAILEGFALIAESRSDKDQNPAQNASTHQSSYASPPTNTNSTHTPTNPAPKIIGSPTKIITQPVRSGQQVYAPGGDLLILSSVSAGAELLADGHIHVMGALRGRALAGINGNLDAMIFCKSLEAELVSIAGQYQISEDLKETLWKQPVRIGLVAGKLNIIDF